MSNTTEARDVPLPTYTADELTRLGAYASRRFMHEHGRSLARGVVD